MLSIWRAVYLAEIHRIVSWINVSSLLLQLFLSGGVESSKIRFNSTMTKAKKEEHRELGSCFLRLFRLIWYKRFDRGTIRSYNHDYDPQSISRLICHERNSNESLKWLNWSRKLKSNRVNFERGIEIWSSIGHITRKKGIEPADIGLGKRCYNEKSREDHVKWNQHSLFVNDLGNRKLNLSKKIRPIKSHQSKNKTTNRGQTTSVEINRRNIWRRFFKRKIDSPSYWGSLSKHEVSSRYHISFNLGFELYEPSFRIWVP